MNSKIIPIYLLNFLLAVSTTIGMTIIPFLATEKLGMSLFVLGIIEGGSELISNMLRLITGNIFDRIKNRRILFILPTILAFGAKILLYLPSALTIFASKIIERIGNGMFAAPRDAFIGENATNKGTALGWLSACKTFGCVIGPVIISVYTFMSAGSLIDNIFEIVILACIINFIGVALSFMITAKKIDKTANIEEFNLDKMKASFKSLLPLFLLAFCFFLGRFNDGLIMIYLKDQGYPEWYYLATISFFNTVMLLASPCMGYLIDKGRDKHILILTIISLLGFNILFSQIVVLPWVFASLGLVLWGLQRAGAQITFTAIIFKNIPVSYYGSAVGVYSVISGIGVFIASMICGYLAQTSFNHIFIYSGIFSILSLSLVFYMYFRKQTVLKMMSDKTNAINIDKPEGKRVSKRIVTTIVDGMLTYHLELNGVKDDTIEVKNIKDGGRLTFVFRDKSKDEILKNNEEQNDR